MAGACEAILHHAWFEAQQAVDAANLDWGSLRPGTEVPTHVIGGTGTGEAQIAVFRLHLSAHIAGALLHNTSGQFLMTKMPQSC